VKVVGRREAARTSGRQNVVEVDIISYCLHFYARQLYRQVLLRARISYGDSVRPSVCHDPVRIQDQVR